MNKSNFSNFFHSLFGGLFEFFLKNSNKAFLNSMAEQANISPSTLNHKKIKDTLAMFTYLHEEFHSDAVFKFPHDITLEVPRADIEQMGTELMRYRVMFLEKNKLIPPTNFGSYRVALHTLFIDKAGKYIPANYIDTYFEQMSLLLGCLVNEDTEPEIVDYNLRQLSQLICMHAVIGYAFLEYLLGD